MSEKSPSSDSKNDKKKDDEFIQPVSEEEGLKSAESVFKVEGKANRTDDPSLDEEKEFFKYLRFCKMAKDLGLHDPISTTINYRGGVHFANSNVENYGNVVGNDQTIHSNTSTGGFSGEVRDKQPSDRESLESIDSVFDKCEDVKQRSFMIALAVLNGCNYRIVVEASQRLQSILQSQAEVETEA
jgi:hypothetical protein